MASKRPGRRPTPAAKAAAPKDKIRLLVLDVDGVMTDGRILLDAQGQEIKQFNSLDGAGIKYWQRAGGQVAIISGRTSLAVVHRAGELGVTLVRQGAKEKLPAYLAMLKELDMPESQVAVMGDDLPDLPIMLRCGYAIAPPNAVDEVKSASALVTLRRGGCGAVREAIERLLRYNGQWDLILKRYRQEPG